MLIFALNMELQQNQAEAQTRRKGFWRRTWDLYYDGFQHMTLGKTLWLIILIKLFIIFVVLKVFFFPNFLSTHTEEGQEAEFVATKLTE